MTRVRCDLILTRVLVALAGLAIAMAGCSSSNDDAGQPLEDSASSSSTTTVTVATTTSTIATTTTISELAKAEAEIEQLLTDWWLGPFDTSVGGDGMGLDHMTGLVERRMREYGEEVTEQGQVVRHQGLERIEVQAIRVDLANERGESGVFDHHARLFGAHAWWMEDQRTLSIGVDRSGVLRDQLMRSANRRRRMTVAAAIVVAVVFMSGIGAAHGQSPPDPSPEVPCIPRSLCGGGSTLPGHPAVTATAIQFGLGDGVFRIPTSSSYLSGCTFEFVPAGEVITIRPGPGSTNLTDVTWPVDYWVIFCTPGSLAYTIYPDGDPPPVDVIDDMIADAYARTPVVAFNPITSPDGDDAIALVVRMPTYLWVDDAEWQTPVSAVASIPGFSVTTTARAASAHWSGGDQPAVCSRDDMVPYDFGRAEDDQRSKCTMIYKRSSAVDNHTVDLDVRWDVSVACSIPVCGGPLPPIVTASSRPVVVKEILAVNS